jgi:RNA polymerase sigma factor (sigma-70 family)
LWRIEGARIVGVLARMLRDIGLAEEYAQEALVAALEDWPEAGVPDKPGAWLMTTARNRALDHLRRRKVLDRKHALLGYELEMQEADTPPGESEVIDDDLLRLIFVASHPVLPPEGRTALTLRVIGGLTTTEIARAFLVPEPTIAQRIVRAKKTLREANVVFEIPGHHELPARLSSVLEAIYLIFNEGYAATAGSDWMRIDLCEEALRIGRILAELVPGESEVHGLVALMEIQASRFAARVDARGNPILLMEQNRARWDRLLIRRGLAALERGRSTGQSAGRYLLQAAIAAHHARAATPEETDWNAIVADYDSLARVAPSPVVELNRAVAVGMAQGAAAGFAITERLSAEGALSDYHLLPSVRGDLLRRLGRLAEARAEFERAAALARNERDRRLLEDRAAQCAGEPV